MSKKDHRGNGSFVKVLRVFHNERKDRPKLNPLERELCSIVISWTGGGNGRYNYQSAKELARMVGSSNKTVLNALHRLKALGLINWYTFPHGVGVKHLRWAPAKGQALWESSKPIHNPTIEEIEKVEEFTPMHVLIAEVCEKPNAVGYDIWRACCDYCGISEKDKEKVQTDGIPEALEIIKSEEVFQAVALPFTSPEFKDAWQEWKQHRRSSGRPLKANAETIALDELKANAENEADAINAINSAIAGGFCALRPDIARSKNTGPTNPIMPVNFWSWAQKRMSEQKRQPEDEEEIKGWAKEFRKYHPDAPGWVIWHARSKQWNVPGMNNKGPAAAGVTGRFIKVCDGYERIRQNLEGGGEYKLDYSNTPSAKQREWRETEDKREYEWRREMGKKIELEFTEKLKTEGIVDTDIPTFSMSDDDFRIYQSVKNKMPRDLDDCEKRFPDRAPYFEKGQMPDFYKNSQFERVI